MPIKRLFVLATHCARVNFCVIYYDREESGPLLTRGRRNIYIFHRTGNAKPFDVYQISSYKETVELRRWESKTGKFGFIKRVDKGRITTVNDLES